MLFFIAGPAVAASVASVLEVLAGLVDPHVALGAVENGVGYFEEMAKAGCTWRFE